MRDIKSGGLALRWWDTLRPAERIVAMSLIAGGAIAIINSTVWAAAVCYMTRQRTLAALARAESQQLSGNTAPRDTVEAAHAAQSALDRMEEIE